MTASFDMDATSSASAGSESAPSPVGGSGARVRARPLWPLRIIGRGLLVIGLVVIATFLLVRVIPGDVVETIAGPRSSEETRAALRSELHLNGSLLSQFNAYVRPLAQGDLGTSIAQRDTPVASIIGRAFPVTLTIVACAILLSLLIGVPVGLLTATADGTKDAATRVLLTVLLALPPFFLGLLLILGFALQLPWLPAGGWEGWGSAPRFLMLPSIALAGSLVPLVARTTRQAAKDAVNEPWYEAAIARGISRRRLMVAHILPNSILPVVTLVGYSAGVLISGAVVVEAVFGLPGIGQELANAVMRRDYPTIQGIALVSAIAVVVCNAVVDVLYPLIDPRTLR